MKYDVLRQERKINYLIFPKQVLWKIYGHESVVGNRILHKETFFVF